MKISNAGKLVFANIVFFSWGNAWAGGVGKTAQVRPLNRIMGKAFANSGTLRVWVAADPARIKGLFLGKVAVMDRNRAGSERPDMFVIEKVDDLYGDNEVDDYASWPGSNKDYLEERRLSLTQARRWLRQLERNSARLETMGAVADEMGLADLRRVTPERSYYLLNVAKLVSHLPRDRRLRESATAKALAALYLEAERVRRVPGLLGFVDHAVAGLRRASGKARRALRDIPWNDINAYNVHYIADPHIFDELSEPAGGR